MRNTSRKTMMISFKLDDELLKRIDALAEKRDRTRSSLIRRMVLRAMKQMERSDSVPTAKAVGDEGVTAA
jgi:predicted transcriptional regulator